MGGSNDNIAKDHRKQRKKKSTCCNAAIARLPKRQWILRRIYDLKGKSQKHYRNKNKEIHQVQSHNVNGSNKSQKLTISHGMQNKQHK